MELLTRLMLNKLKNASGGGSGTSVYKNAGAHNSIYRGKDITDLFYDGTLSQQISAGTFDDIYVGDYIIGSNSGTKYLVADINYLINTGNTATTKNHVLIIPEKIMGNAKMNTNSTTSGGYAGSAMHTTNLASYKTTIQEDFGSQHILSHEEILTNAVSSGKSSGWDWTNVTVEIMNEVMVYGHNVWASAPSYESGIDRSQLSLFKHRHDLITATNENNERVSWWLRDVVSATDFAFVYPGGITRNSDASVSAGVRPSFLIY